MPQQPSSHEPKTSPQDKPYCNQGALDNYLKRFPGASPEEVTKLTAEFKEEVEAFGF
jgi:hypothetical protein